MEGRGRKYSIEHSSRVIKDCSTVKADGGMMKSRAICPTNTAKLYKCFSCKIDLQDRLCLLLKCLCNPEQLSVLVFQRMQRYNMHNDVPCTD